MTALDFAMERERPVKDILHDLVGAFDRLSEEVERSIQVRDAMDARWRANALARTELSQAEPKVSALRASIPFAGEL